MSHMLIDAIRHINNMYYAKSSNLIWIKIIDLCIVQGKVRLYEHITFSQTKLGHFCL